MTAPELHLFAFSVQPKCVLRLMQTTRYFIYLFQTNHYCHCRKHVSLLAKTYKTQE